MLERLSLDLRACFPGVANNAQGGLFLIEHPRSKLCTLEGILPFCNITEVFLSGTRNTQRTFHKSGALGYRLVVLSLAYTLSAH